MKRKKILFLGGAHSQLPAIKYAKSIGLKVITADYLPSNPGHKISDEYYNISTVDKERILELSKKIKIDAISAYASDPAAPTAAYVSEKMRLVGSSYKAVMTLSDKLLFRTFLKENGFKTPWYFGSEVLEDLTTKYPGGKAILKPVDSSGSKGISLVNNIEDLKKNFPLAMKYSRSKHVIVEEFIERKGPQIHGEGFVLNGEIVFILLGDQVFSPSNNLIPYSTIVPSICHKDIMNEAHQLVKSAIEKVGFNTGGLNIEIIRDKHDHLYILEIGARNGGNFMPQLMKHATGFDLVKANIDALINEKIIPLNTKIILEHYTQVILHAENDGLFVGIDIPDKLHSCIEEKHIYYRPGQIIKRYKDSGDVIGVAIFKLREQEHLNIFKLYLDNNNWTVYSPSKV